MHLVLIKSLTCSCPAKEGCSSTTDLWCGAFRRGNRRSIGDPDAV